MVDVWNELGKALGRALKPLAEMPKAVWKAFGDAAGGLIEGFRDAAGGLRDSTKPIIEGLMPNIFEEATAALSEGSPPKEIKESVDKFIKQLMKMVEKESKTTGKSLPTAAELATRQAALAGGITGMYALTHAISMALDASHPLKDWGFKSAVMDMMYQFKMSEVIGPMISAPIWASVVAPLRMRANADYPYQVPGTGVLPYLVAKGIIDDETYKLNMKYSAYDASWSDAMLENTWRYPDFSDMRTLIHRGAKTWADARAVLAKTLVKAEYLDAYEKLLPSVPGSGDLVDMAVREAYQPRSGDEEMPGRFVAEMAKQGFDQEACLWFWRKHWVLPGVGQVYDMYHRGIRMPQTLAEFLKVADYAPEWRKPLEELSWKLPGRIDARWLYKWGEIGVDELRDLLEKEGLSKEWSGRVAVATAKNQYLSDINREIGNIKADYARGYSVEATLRGDLKALGMRGEIVEYHVADALADRVRSIRDSRLATLRVQYSRGAITLADAITEAEKVVVDKEARDAWVEALPTAKQVMIMEETSTTDTNRLVTNVKYDYVRGYVEKPAMVSRLQLLGLPDTVIEYHVMDADEDRQRKRNDDRLIVIKGMWMKDVETDFDVITGWVTPIIVEKEARDLWLSDAYFDKFRTVTR